MADTRVIGKEPVVVVPRNAYQVWRQRPWSEMVAAAEAGMDGLRLEAREIWTSGPVIYRVPGCAVFRDAKREFSRADVAALHTQEF